MPKEQLIMMLRILLANDLRVMFCTLDKVEDRFEHTNKCPRCAAIHLIENA